MANLTVPDLYTVDTSIADTDFTGFTYNGVHSSELGITRVSNGSRYSSNLLPTFTDTTATNTNYDGTFYFSSTYTKREFQVSIAYDDMTETQIRKLSQLVGDKSTHELVFDEMPFKVYSAKVTSSPQLQFVCFEEIVGYSTSDNSPIYGRKYRGEGTITFTAYLPFAKQLYTSKTALINADTPVTVPYKEYKKYLENYTERNKEQWADSSTMLKTNYEVYDLDTCLVYSSDPLKGHYELFNAGDIETSFRLPIAFNNSSSVSYLKSIAIYTTDATRTEPSSSDTPLGIIKFDFSKTSHQGDAYMVLDSRTRLIEGYDEHNEKTGNIYNNAMITGDFFNIPIGRSTLVFTVADDADKVLNPIEYSYLYY